METDTTTAKDTARAAVLEWLRDNAEVLLPVPMVCGLAGISESSLKYHREAVPVCYVTVGLRMILAVKARDVMDTFFPDGSLTDEARDFYEVGLKTECFTFAPDGQLYRILYAGMMEWSKAELHIMRDKYKRGSGKRGAPKGRK